ncbi:hypothetical protein SAMD00019534_050500 [Acytostelium subglobosum LB1]|uniref:hypothetical protein n=1 Tax=Acytostelium subglobosum LB1 TaxID=1410327 RepID=UPI000644AE82|nr:hypothetical protein SAMD00019534_050500 [Acytostelium subglobosum LB1]GAM21875.1 hypothetical protein SAMD00019534_050500 [Acytostelium subglobosum LB1]|eukprot:XP_012754975.1 hypothetical protein SAMD00019534_050500 [Acytostelium subglobosum LB1]
MIITSKSRNPVILVNGEDNGEDIVSNVEQKHQQQQQLQLQQQQLLQQQQQLQLQQQQLQLQQQQQSECESLPFQIIRTIFDHYFVQYVHYCSFHVGRANDRFLYVRLAPIAMLSRRYFDLVSHRYVVRFVENIKYSSEMDMPLRDYIQHLSNKFCFIKSISSLECSLNTFDQLIAHDDYCTVFRSQLLSLTLSPHQVDNKYVQADQWTTSTLLRMATFQALQSVELKHVRFSRELFETLLSLKLTTLSIGSVQLVDRMTSFESDLFFDYLKREQGYLHTLDLADCIRLGDEFIELISNKPTITTLTIPRIKKVVKIGHELKSIRLSSCRNKFLQLNIESNIQSLTIPSINAKHIDTLTDFIKYSITLTSLNVYLCYPEKHELSKNCVEIFFNAFERLFTAINESKNCDQMVFLFSAYPKFLQPQLERLFGMLLRIQARCNTVIIEYDTNRTDYDQLLQDLSKVDYGQYQYCGVTESKRHLYKFNTFPNQQQSDDVVTQQQQHSINQ